MARSVAMTEANPGVDAEPSRSMVPTAVAVAAGWLIIDVLIGYTADGPLAALLGLGGFVLAIAALWNLAAVARARRPQRRAFDVADGRFLAPPAEASGFFVASEALLTGVVAVSPSAGGAQCSRAGNRGPAVRRGVQPRSRRRAAQPHLRYPLRRRNRQRVAVAAYLARVDAGFLAAAIAHYLAHPEQRSGIGTPAGHDELRAALGDTD